MRFTSLLSFWMLFIAVTDSVYTPCKICIDQASPKKLSEIELILYTGPRIQNYTKVKIDDASKLCDKLNKSKPTAIFVFGWIGTPRSPHTEAIVNAYNSRGDHNVMVLNWETISIHQYSYAMRSVRSVGYKLAMAINEFMKCGLDPNTLHLIGHSLGAQICGFTGRNVDRKLLRITGLDPAGPGYYILSEHLTSKDANFVDIIHTDRGGLGIKLQTGHVDFYPNDGRYPQPGCSLIPLASNGCGHYRSVYMFAQSVHNESSFLGYACDSDCNSTALMGQATSTDTRGKYCLNIDGELLYGQSEGYTLFWELIPVIEYLGNDSFLLSQLFQFDRSSQDPETH